MKQLSKIASATFLLIIILLLSIASYSVHALEAVATISLPHSGGCYGLAYDSQIGRGIRG